jgi:hypothetical protein
MSEQHRLVTLGLARLESLADLKPGWDSYGGKAPTPEAIAAARVMIEWEPTATPLSGGGVQLEWHAGGYDIEIRIAPDGREVSGSAEPATSPPPPAPRA